MKHIILFSILLFTFSLSGFSQVNPNQLLGSVSKNCKSYFSKDCKSILIDVNGNVAEFDFGERIEVTSFDKSVERLYFRYRDNPKLLLGLMDYSGNIIKEPSFEGMGEFFDGIAPVDLKGGKLGFIDKNGKVVYESSFIEDDEVASSPRGTNEFSDGLMLVGIQVSYSLMASRPIIKYGFINKKGKMVVGESNTPLLTYRGFKARPKFEDAKNFTEGVAAVQLEGKWGYVNKEDKIVIDFQFDDANRFSEGLASVKENGKYGFIDKSGNFVIKPQFDGAGEFSEGLAPFGIGIGISEGRWGFLDKSGNIVIPNKLLREPKKFSDGMSMIFEGGKGEGFGYINKQGEIVIKPQFGGASDFKDGFAWVLTKGGAGYIKKNGEYLWNPSQ